MIIPKKEILYAPMLGTLGGGSARGFGQRGRSGSAPGILGHIGATVATYDGVTFYHGAHSDSVYTSNSFELQVDAGKSFYMGMVGASGAGAISGTRSGGGGVGVVLVTVPSGVSAMTVYMGGGGTYETNGGPANGGQNFGGHGGDPSGGYNASMGGGGFVGLIQGTSLSHNNVIACVGSGGAMAAHASGGDGGGFNQNGLQELSSSGNPHGSGGTLSAGGAGSTYNPSWGNTGGAGSALTGGNGGNSTYDGGGGGGAGYYGGGGGTGGGGYDGGAGGGGSGYANTTYVAIESGKNTHGGSYSYPANQLQTWVREVSGASSYTIPSINFGAGVGQAQNGRPGTAVFWNVT